MPHFGLWVEEMKMNVLFAPCYSDFWCKSTKKMRNKG